MNIKNGLDYFPLETDLFTDDEKVFDLMDGTTGDAAFADFGRFMNLLCRIYRDGPAIEVGPRMAKRIAHDLGLTTEEFEAFVGRCTDAGLFHSEMWEQERVLTSMGIQRRWKAAKKRTGMPAAMRQWSLLGEAGGWGEARTHDEATDAGAQGPRAAVPDARSAAREISQNSESLGKSRPTRQKSQNPRLKRKEKKTKQKEKEKKEDQRKEVLPSEFEETEEQPAPPPSQDIDLDLSSLVPPCMAREYGDSVFLDDQDAPHRTPYGALAARYESQTGRRDFGDCMAKVHGMCPAGCRASPRDVSECHGLIAGAIDKADPAKGSPWALIRHVLTYDRGSRNA